MLGPLHELYFSVSIYLSWAESNSSPSQKKKKKKTPYWKQKTRRRIMITLSLSGKNAGPTIWRWWNQLSPLAINKPLPMKCLDPSCWSHDFPESWLYLEDRSSLIISVSVTHILGSLPYQYMNLLPTPTKRHKNTRSIQQMSLKSQLHAKNREK